MSEKYLDTEELTEELNEELNEELLDTDELIFHLITIKKLKEDVQVWLKDLNELDEGKREMKDYHPSTHSTINYYLSGLKHFFELLMKALKKSKDLTRCNK